MSFEQINLIIGNPSWDMIVIFAFVAIGFFYGISAGKTRMVAFLFSLYISGFLFENFSYLERLISSQTLMETFLFRVFFFFLIVLVIGALISQFINIPPEASEKNWWHILLISFSSTGLLFSYLFALFPAREVITFSPIVQTIFASNTAFFWWLTVPLVSLFLARK